MAQSATIINGKALYVSVGGQAIAGSTMSASLTVDIENSQHYTADGDFAFALVGKRRWSGTLNIYYSETATEAYAECVSAFEGGTNSALVISVAGNNSGDEALSGNAYFTQIVYPGDASTAAALQLAVPFVGNGALTRANVA